MGSDRSIELRPLPIDEAAEREYNLRLRHPERSAVYERFSQASASLRGSLADEHIALRYADSPSNVIDFFPASGASRPAPLFVFIHGGYWRALDRGIFSFLARPWLERGVHVALPGYDLVPTATLPEMVGQVRAATERLLEDAAGLAIDPARVLIGGHSAGAHLGAMLLMSTPARRWPVRGFVGISGLYDLTPLLATTVNADIRLDAEQARILSPRWLSVDPRTSYLCAVGGAETRGFIGQSQDFVAALHRQRAAARYLEIPQRTHFDILDALADPDAPLFRGAFALLDHDPSQQESP